MNLVIIGRFPADTAARIRAFFPPDWKVALTGPDDLCLRDAEALIPEHLPVNAVLLDRAPKLRMIQTGAGSDNVDLAECTRRGILVCSAAGVNAAAVAEHTMALILGWFKNIVYLDTFLKARRDSRELCYSGGELLGKTAGIIGFGRIGQTTGRIAKALGMKVLAYDLYPNDSGKAIAEYVDLDTLLAQSDVVFLHCNLTADNEKMINKANIAKMKDGAILINNSRGQLIDEQDVTDALKAGKLAAAGLDVVYTEPIRADNPLLTAPNCIITPHMSWGAKEARQRIMDCTVDNVRAYLQGAPINVVNP